MVCSHRRSAEEGTSAPLLPEKAEEVWKEPQRPQIILLLHCGEHPDRLHHRLVWKQHRWQPQSSAKGCVCMYCLYVNCFCTGWSTLSRISLTKARADVTIQVILFDFYRCFKTKRLHYSMFDSS